jgi:hypothetical protein
MNLHERIRRFKENQATPRTSRNDLAVVGVSSSSASNHLSTIHKYAKKLDIDLKKVPKVSSFESFKLRESMEMKLSSDSGSSSSNRSSLDDPWMKNISVSLDQKKHPEEKENRVPLTGPVFSPRREIAIKPAQPPLKNPEEVEVVDLLVKSTEENSEFFKQLLNRLRTSEPSSRSSSGTSNDGERSSDLFQQIKRRIFQEAAEEKLTLVDKDIVVAQQPLAVLHEVQVLPQISLVSKILTSETIHLVDIEISAKEEIRESFVSPDSPNPRQLRMESLGISCIDTPQPLLNESRLNLEQAKILLRSNEGDDLLDFSSSMSSSVCFSLSEDTESLRLSSSSATSSIGCQTENLDKMPIKTPRNNSVIKATHIFEPPQVNTHVKQRLYSLEVCPGTTPDLVIIEQPQVSQLIPAESIISTPVLSPSSTPSLMPRMPPPRYLDPVNWYEYAEAIYKNQRESFRCRIYGN